MAMVTAMVMATGTDRGDRFRHTSIPRPRSLARRPVAAAIAGLRWAVCVGCAAAATSALAENWRVTASASATETYSSNANYSTVGAPSASDFTTSVSGALNIHGAGGRVKLNGSIGATGLFYARETQNNSFAPSVNLTGNVEAIEKFLWVDAQAYVTQTFLSPFGPQPGNIATATGNRYTSQTYSIIPYIQGLIGGTKLTYLVRDENVWTVGSPFGGGSVDAPNTYLNRLTANVSAPPVPWGWTLEYTGTRYEPTDPGVVGSYTVQVGRAIITYQFDPTLQVAGRVGYEDAQFPLTSTRDTIYGANVAWTPSDRTSVTGFYEHRFFGSSYNAQISHRLPRTALSASFARGLSTYPQNALSIPAGANVASFVDAAFTTRIPDPAERALAVQQFIAQSGLPSVLATPVNVFAASVQLQTTGNVSAVVLGVRNSLAFNAYYTKSTAISGTGSALPPAFQFGQDNTQTGGGVSFSHQLSGFTSLTASATVSTTKSNTTDGAFADAKAVNSYLNLGLGTRIGPKTSASAGVGYSRYDPGGNANLPTSSSFSAYAGVNHTF